ncbi:MAG: hypothetical protein ACFE8A_09495 [Candidatus Hodarchaeota archaeon]
MGKEKEKDKKDKHKKEKNKKDKDKKEKEKKEKEKKEKEKKDKKDKDKGMPDQEWKITISKNLDVVIGAYQKIVKIFQDIDNYILKDAKNIEEFKEKVQKIVADLPENQKEAFIAFLNAI